MGEYIPGKGDIDLFRTLLAMELTGENEIVTPEERELTMFQIPASILKHIDIKDDEQMLFLRDYSDTAIFRHRIAAGNVERPIQTTSTVLN